MKLSLVLFSAFIATTLAENKRVRKTHAHENIAFTIALPPIPVSLPLVKVTVNAIDIMVNTSAPIKFEVIDAPLLAASSRPRTSTTRRSSTSSTKKTSTSTKKSTSSTRKTTTTTKPTTSSTKTTSSTSRSSASSTRPTTSSSTSRSSTSNTSPTISSSSTRSTSSTASSTPSTSTVSSSSSSSTESSSTTESSSSTDSSSSSSSSSSTSSPATTSSSTSTTSTSSSSTTSATTTPSLIANSVSSTILIIAKDLVSAREATTGLNGYGIPYQVLVVPQAGIDLPVLNSTATTGNFGGIVILSEISYNYGTPGAENYHSALTDAQWITLYTYQLQFGVRMVRIDVYPSPTTGTTPAAGCCVDGQEQFVSFNNITAFPTAGLRAGAQMSTAGLYHYIATITNPSIATSFLTYGSTTGTSGTYAAGGVGGVINNISGRQQMVFFITFGIDFSPTSNLLQHSWINWITRGIYVGYRRINLITQIDDMFLDSDIYLPAGNIYRLKVDDLVIHKTWTTTINNKLINGGNLGSSYFIEIAHNGNGNIIAADKFDTGNPPTCGIGAIDLGDQAFSDTPLEFQKPLGTGTSLWPANSLLYPYTVQCLNLDSMKLWFATPANRDVFAHMSHTFTHEAENNATYFDIFREITWNQAWLTQSGLAAATKFSPHGIVPPAITGLHNGDAIKAWMDNGITNVVGDNSRPVLRNQQNVMWPYITNVADNGYAGLLVSPRWPTNIYYNCDTPNCTTQEWITFSRGAGDFNDLLNYEKRVTTRYLFGLYHDAYMFHQANLRVSDIPVNTNINGVTAKISIFQAWVETIVQEVIRTVTWPVITIKHDDMGAQFAARMARDACSPKMSYLIDTSTQKITGVSVGANGNTCDTKIPVTVPGTVVDTKGATTEKIGTDPLTLWTTLTGAPVSYTLTTPISF